MAEHAGLTAVRAERRNARIYLVCSGENGAEREFSISLGNRSDPRGDLNQLSLMKRFARENTVARDTAAAPTTTNQPTMTTKKNTRTPTAPSIELSPLDFYRLCEWLKTKASEISALPSFDAMALAITQHIGQPVENGTIQQAMQVTGVAEPVHWSDPTDPTLVLARELATLMKSLGAAQSAAFAKLVGQLHKVPA
ncbi:hypothetical protein C4F17_26730 [Variovorax sp. PMC12]|nr:hypothetical protein C4F17_26730 [Variovorax sp. PMC12]